MCSQALPKQTTTFRPRHCKSINYNIPLIQISNKTKIEYDPARNLESKLGCFKFSNESSNTTQHRTKSYSILTAREDQPSPSTTMEASTQAPPVPAKLPLRDEREEGPKPSVLDPASFAKPFISFMSNNPTTYHATTYFADRLTDAGFSKLTEREKWDLKAGGKYFVERNGSSLIAFAVGADFEAGNGFAAAAAHIDSLAVRLKPVSKLRNKAGFVQLGVAPYAGALNSTWWDRDLGIGGRVLVKTASGKVETKLVKLDYPIARVPTLAPHFGAPANGPFNLETNMVPIIGIDNSDLSESISTVPEFSSSSTIGGAKVTFTSTQPPGLVKVIAGELGIKDYSEIVNWDLELFDTQPAQLGGLNKDLLFAGRIDDKICSWTAIEGLILSTEETASTKSTDGIVKLVGLFDDEEIGSLLRQGARGNFLPTVVERVTEAFVSDKTPASGPGLYGQAYANSFLVSADVTHAVNPNFLGQYLENHSPRLNVGIAVAADPNGMFFNI
jgi:aminopeptidase I